MGCTGLLPCGWNVPLDLQMLALHLLSTAGMACPLQAHCATGHPPLIHCLLSLQDPSGTAGREMKEEMVKKIEKWQEPPPAKTAKVLPVPDAEGKKRRGGKRYRKMKVGGRAGGMGRTRMCMAMCMAGGACKQNSR